MQQLIPIGHYPRSRFGALCDLYHVVKDYDVVKNNKWGCTEREYWHAKMGLSVDNIYMLQKRENNFRYGAVFFGNKIDSLIYRAIIEFKDIYLPKYLRYCARPNGYYFRDPSNNRSYRKRQLIGKMPAIQEEINKFKPFNKPRATVRAAITEDVADIILDLMKEAGQTSYHYRKVCKGILGECAEMVKILGRNPAITRADTLGTDSKRAPFVYFVDTVKIKTAYKGHSENVLAMMNGVPNAYQHDICLRLVKWWLEMLLDGTLAAAREGKVLKYKNPYTKRIIFLHPDTIRKVIMERKQRTKAEIPSVTVTRKDLAKHQYSVVKNKEGKGFILSKEGFKLSGLTGREVYIASVIINHERKNSHDTALLAEAIAAAAKRQAQIQAQREQTEEPTGG